MDRNQLQSKLEELLGSSRVYYQPSASITLEYPAIVYTKSDIVTNFANNGSYTKTKRYDITVMDRKPDHPVIERLLDLPHASFNRHYKSDNLNHDVIILYW